jgi:hypothetical protein
MPNATTPTAATQRPLLDALLAFLNSPTGQALLQSLLALLLAELTTKTHA